MTFKYMLAPMEDLTDSSFKTLCYKYGADLTFTEMIRIEGLAKKNENSWQRLEPKDETPTVVQLLGNNEEYLKEFLKNFNPKPGFKGININIGCPNPQVIKLGYGCSMVRRAGKVKRLINIIKDRSYEASIKMRLGLNETEKKNKLYIGLIQEVDADYFIVHARHGQETYTKPADFSVYEECTKTGKTIIANGDIGTKEQILFLKEKGVKGAMIGKAAVTNPQIFNMLKGEKIVSIEQVKKDYNELIKKFNPPFRYQKNILKRLV